MKPKLILIGVGAALLLLGVWFFAFWSPQSKSLDAAAADNAGAVAKEADLQVTLARLRKIEANSAKLEADKARLDTLMPATDQVDKFITDIHQMAIRTSVDLVSIAPTAPVTAAAAPGATPATGGDGAPVNIGLALQANGEYAEILRFLEAVRDGGRLVTIDSLSLTPVEGTTVSASITARMFIYPSAATAAAKIPSA